MDRDEPYEGEDRIDDPVETEGDYETLEDERLDLADDDETLPWLESGEDDYDQGGPDTGRVIAFALIGILALAAILGGIWWATNRSADGDMVADGSLIEAPDGPVKERPDDPGGTEVAGTGDVAPMTGEGERVEGRVAERDAQPAPGVDVRRPDESADESDDGEGTTGSQASGVAVQVGAYSTRARAEQGWTQLTGQSDALSGVSHRVVEGTADIGTVYRLQAMAGSLSAANALCTRLKGDGIACQVKR